tara:strand:- start:1304 stop:2014 length:711 start_codon:yes stop_codon:yes gene_type:complete
MEKIKKIKILLGLTYFVIVLLFLWYFFTYFSLDEISSYKFIKNNRDFLIEFRQNNFFLIATIFFILVIFWVLLLGFGSPVALLGGFIFGKWIGTVIVSISLTIGATLLYIFANFFLKEIIKEKFERRFHFLKIKFKKNELFYFFIYRFIGGIPFFIANILPSLFDVKIKNYFFGSFFGMIPGLFIITSLGNGLEKIISENAKPPTFFELITYNEISIPIIAFLFLLLVAYLIRRKY